MLCFQTNTWCLHIKWKRRAEITHIDLHTDFLNLNYCLFKSNVHWWCLVMTVCLIKRNSSSQQWKPVGNSIPSFIFYFFMSSRDVKIILLKHSVVLAGFSGALAVLGNILVSSISSTFAKMPRNYYTTVPQLFTHTFEPSTN